MQLLSLFHKWGNWDSVSLHYLLNIKQIVRGHELEQTPEDRGGQGSLACCCLSQLHCLSGVSPCASYYALLSFSFLIYKMGSSYLPHRVVMRVKLMSIKSPAEGSLRAPEVPVPVFPITHGSSKYISMKQDGLWSTVRKLSFYIILQLWNSRVLRKFYWDMSFIIILAV